MRTNRQQADLEKLILSGRRIRMPKGQALYFTDDQYTLIILTEGFVKRYLITNDGSQSIQSIYGAYDVFPITPVFKILFGQPVYTGLETAYYEAVTPITFHAINRATLEQAVQDNPKLHRDILYACGIRLRTSMQRLENSSLKSAKKQIAHELVFLAEEFGSKKDGKVYIDMPLTHQTLASILNLARETVTVALNRLAEKELIETGAGLVILDLEGLIKAAR